METPAYRRTPSRKASKTFQLDFLRRNGTRYYFGTTSGKSAGRHPHLNSTNAAWSVASLMGVIALIGWLLGWPVMMMGTLWVVVVGLLTVTFVIERRAGVTSQDIVIDAKDGTLTLPSAVNGTQGTYRMEDLILAVRSDSPDIATTAVTRDYYVIIEGELESSADATKSFEVKLIGPGYLPEMNDEAGELRALGRWRYQRFDH